jgi:outer membrane immunogenic protein
MKRVVLVAAGIGFVTLATPAAAQLRAEVHGGFERTTGTINFAPPATVSAPVTAEGAFGGIGVGYDLHTEGTDGFIGIEANADYSAAEDCIDTPGATPAPQLCLSPTIDLSVNGRLGIRTGAFSIYALAGYSKLMADTSFSGVPGSTANGPQSGDEDLGGFRIGGGVEVNVSANMYAKLEYRHTNYADGFVRDQGLVGIGIRF